MRTERLRKKLNAFRNICLEAASLSEDTKYQVGAIVFRKNFMSIPSIAYNGNYAGGPNERDSMESGQSGYIHAEINALLRSGITPETAPAFAIMISMSPCKMCAKSIVNSGIKTVFYLKRYDKDDAFKDIFRNAGVQCVLLEKLPDDDSVLTMAVMSQALK